MRHDDTTPQPPDDTVEKSDDEQPEMLRPCGFPRGYFLKNRSVK